MKRGAFFSAAGAASRSAGARSDGRPKRPATLTDLVKKLHSKLGHAEALSLTEHLKAARLLCSIRNRLSNEEILDSKTMIMLLCSGIACHRRWSVGDVGETTAGASAKNEADELKMREKAAADKARKDEENRQYQRV